MDLLYDVKQLLFENGANLVGFTNLALIDQKVRKKFSLGISIAVALDRRVIEGISEGPTAAYHEEYVSANIKLDRLSGLASVFLEEHGCSTDHWGATEDRIYGHHMTDLPHKTVATLSGLGWIGKCALLVTKEYGSAVRLTTVLADTGIDVPDNSFRESRCRDCDACVTACPGHAPSGINWTRGTERDTFFDADACRETARRLARELVGIELTFCGICIVSCPYTKGYVRRRKLKS